MMKNVHLFNLTYHSQPPEYNHPVVKMIMTIIVVTTAMCGPKTFVYTSTAVKLDLSISVKAVNI